ncbi:hypothetical protein KCTC32516_00311 [Polaribacter huanghezhanensis]|uniref:hypothetical protein n=1 Tax=Polaribacter huanghezhanensis TaxID=1354726 RepID=UPI002649F655|nr:hypothetical protein [Polaribacter huanghezhanensis]WKD84974.1 hypothetical protein KCTC32516_00311 [Polaribacter huanghezhanensis]
MKKIAFALAFILTASAGFSQQRKRMAKADMMTPEQRATLSVKRMALQLDLTKDQTQKITALYTEMGTQRKVKGDQMRKEAMASRDKIAKIKKESKDRADFKEKVGKAIKSGELKKEGLKRRRGKRVDFDTANKALDNRIEFQAKMKKILSPEQYEKFTKLQKRKVGKLKKKMASKMKNKKTKMSKRGKGKR